MDIDSLESEFRERFEEQFEGIDVEYFDHLDSLSFEDDEGNSFHAEKYLAEGDANDETEIRDGIDAILDHLEHAVPEDVEKIAVRSPPSIRVEDDYDFAMIYIRVDWV